MQAAATESSSDTSENEEQSGSEDGLASLLKQIRENTEGDKTTLGDVLDALDTRSFGPLLLVPALMAVSPVGAIPGMSIVTGLVVMLLSVQLLISQKHPWLPTRLENFSFSRETLHNGIDKTLPWAEWLDKFTDERLTFLTKAPFRQMIAIIMACLAAMFVPLALLPFAVSVPGTAVALFALGLTARDGVFVLIGIAVSGAALWLTLAMWPF
ncbi:exopolysaccharide biosynthesis protein [Blastopirellula marina]|uniref:Polysaccharide synthesis protein exod n=1 Tax=Blastopirellula marina TaxID=124 RepID=A0A2S8GQ18_9BACT|nr:exopolysaccharide biosynthesis protein [Blastopirellula marina]PQO46520.1 hypothetical protein C5Y93_08575 [Blastopirellula marina]